MTEIKVNSDRLVKWVSPIALLCAVVASYAVLGSDVDLLKSNDADQKADIEELQEAQKELELAAVEKNGEISGELSTVNLKLETQAALLLELRDLMRDMRDD